MIPILYDIGEIEFESNGLGRLRDCISCKVTEERNGIYECEFEYPVDGAHFDEIICGRSIAVEHDDTNDVQPFDIYSYEKPIDGVVTFHAKHISYRQANIVVSGTNVNNLASAFALLSSGVPSNPFTYSTDKTSSTGYMAAADGIPRTVRQMLGGVEGSILDTYGGEYEWNRFNVILHSSRGERKDYTIRYGLNLVDYNEEVDYSGTYTAVVPYWGGEGSEAVIGSLISSGQTAYDGTNATVPLDLTDKFENKPTVAQLEAMAQSMLASNDYALPNQTISVDFVRLEDSEEYESYSNLQHCKLCDSVRVVFPRYQMEGYFKIVKTVYDVLLERFESMELGNLSTSLSEALGISDSLSGTPRQSSGENYIRYDNGLQICWINASVNMAINNAYGSLYQGTYTWTFPVAFASAPTVAVGAVKWGSGASWGTLGNASGTASVIIRGIDAVSRASGSTHIEAIAVGWWK